MRSIPLGGVPIVVVSDIRATIFCDDRKTAPRALLGKNVLVISGKLEYSRRRRRTAWDGHLMLTHSHSDGEFPVYGQGKVMLSFANLGIKNSLR